ncbi:MAG: indole-3-glycerol phosphate synthase TrpC [bacterium]
MILDQIIDGTKAKLQRKLEADPDCTIIKAKADELRDIRAHESKRSFYKALHAPDGHLALIAEIKRASPSVGSINESLDPAIIAGEYEKFGASALSVLTEDSYFKGDISDLERAKKSVSLPILRKDFIIHPYQIYESFIVGADAILLIACALSATVLTQLYQLAGAYMLDALVEVHNKEDIDKILAIEPRIIGINNRDLTTFTVDITTTAQLIPYIKEKTRGIEPVIVSESGIKTKREAKFVVDHGARAILVGEALVKSNRREELIRELINPFKA